MLTGLQVINEVEDRLGWKQSSTLEGSVPKETRKLTRLLNRVLKTLCIIEQWPMLRTEGTLITEAAIEQSLLLNLTNGSVSVSISAFDSSGFTFEESHKQWAVQLGSDASPIYRIAKVVSPTSIELNRVWLGDTVTPASASDATTAVTMAMDQYVLPEDYDRPTGDWADFLSAYNVKPKDPEDFAKERRKEGRRIVTGSPALYTVYGLDPSETYQILHLHPWPDTQTYMEYTYQRVHPVIAQDTDRVLMTQTSMVIVVEAMITFANRDYEDDQRWQAAMMEFVSQFKAVGAQHPVTAHTKQLTPWSNRARAPLCRVGGGLRVDYGDHFDIAGNTDLP